MKPIPLELIELGRKQLLENARSLIAEAELLFDRGFVARAYALAHLAGEELAKLPMYVRAGIEAELGHEVDWKELRAKTSSHLRKLKALHALDYLVSEVRADNSDVTDYLTALQDTPSWNALKNSSLYVSIGGDGVQAPSDAVDNARASEAIAEAKSKFSFFEIAENATAGKIKQLVSDPSTVRLLGVLTDLESGKFD